MKIDYRKTAHQLISKGISVVPLRTDGSKLPSIKWKHLQKRYMTEQEVEKEFKACGGIAAITGEISRLYCLDFDLKYQLEDQDYWKDFTEQIPKHVKAKMLINETKNQGKHIWVRTDYEATSTHLTRRSNTIPELMVKYEAMMAKGDRTPQQASELLLKRPYEVIIETRSRGSYAVIAHPEYTRWYGDSIKEFTMAEVEMLNNAAYALDYCYTPKSVFRGDKEAYSTIRQYNDAGSGYKTLQMLESTGMFSYVATESGGNMRVLRLGSKSGYSGRVYADTGVFHLFSPNTLFDTSASSSFSPFEVYRITNNLEEEEAIRRLSTV